MSLVVPGAVSFKYADDVAAVIDATAAFTWVRVPSGRSQVEAF